MPRLQALDNKGQVIPGKVKFHTDAEYEKILRMRRPRWKLVAPEKPKQPEERSKPKQEVKAESSDKESNLK